MTARRFAASAKPTWIASRPEATTLLKFRRPLENKELTPKIFEAINGYLAAQG